MTGHEPGKLGVALSKGALYASTPLRVQLTTSVLQPMSGSTRAMLVRFNDVLSLSERSSLSL